MLEKPLIQEASLIACLQTHYGLPVTQVHFLPLGADLNTAAYQATTTDQTVYFVKLRQGGFDETSVTLPNYLSDQGISQIIAPLPDRAGQLWVDLDPFKLILYPFVVGHDGYQVEISTGNWAKLGAALRSIHAAELPPEFSCRIRKETYSSLWRKIVRLFIDQLASQVLIDSVAEELAEFLFVNQDQISFLVERADCLAQALLIYPSDYVLCHSDLHPGNFLISPKDDLYIVDWDDPLLAPKERDLMFIGGGFGFIGHTAEEESALFYSAYGKTQIDRIALAYYRYERIIQDIAVECQQIFISNEGGEDRERALVYLKSNFLENGTIESAMKSDPLRRD